jgi:hypothetical protein
MRLPARAHVYPRTLDVGRCCRHGPGQCTGVHSEVLERLLMRTPHPLALPCHLGLHFLQHGCQLVRVHLCNRLQYLNQPVPGHGPPHADAPLGHRQMGYWPRPLAGHPCGSYMVYCGKGSHPQGGTSPRPIAGEHFGTSSVSVPSLSLRRPAPCRAAFRPAPSTRPITRIQRAHHLLLRCCRR